jgi:hypothetical protein
MFLDTVAVGGKSRSNSPPHGRGDGAWPCHIVLACATS